MDLLMLDLSYDKCEFEVVSGELVISDPCYSEETWCQGVVKAKNGKWYPNAETVNMEGWGNRVVTLVAGHEEFWSYMSDDYKEDFIPPVWEKLPFSVGVDSGQAGIFDFSHYRDDSVVKEAYRLTKTHIGQDREGSGGDWYGMCCDRTLSFYKWGLIPYGVVSSSGLGDGMYSAFAVKNDEGEVIAVKIIFIPVEVKEIAEE
jgi:hypothetical protein